MGTLNHWKKREKKKLVKPTCLIFFLFILPYVVIRVMTCYSLKAKENCVVRLIQLRGFYILFKSECIQMCLWHHALHFYNTTYEFLYCSVYIRIHLKLYCLHSEYKICFKGQNPTIYHNLAPSQITPCTKYTSWVVTHSSTIVWVMEWDKGNG